MKLAAAALGAILAGGGVAAAGVVLLTSGPFTQTSSEEQATQTPVPTEAAEGATGEDGTATPEPTETPEGTSIEGEGRLAELASEVDTDEWILVDEEQVWATALMPESFAYTIREWDDYIVGDPGVPIYELVIRPENEDDRTPMPAHEWRDEQLTVSIVFLPEDVEPIPFGESDATVFDSTTMSVDGREVQVRDFDDEHGPRRVVATGSLELGPGTLHIFGIATPAEEDEQVTTLLGILQSIDAR